MGCFKKRWSLFKHFEVSTGCDLAPYIYTNIRIHGRKAVLLHWIAPNIEILRHHPEKNELQIIFFVTNDITLEPLYYLSFSDFLWIDDLIVNNIYLLFYDVS